MCFWRIRIESGIAFLGAFHVELGFQWWNLKQERERERERKKVRWCSKWNLGVSKEGWLYVWIKKSRRLCAFRRLYVWHVVAGARDSYSFHRDYFRLVCVRSTLVICSWKHHKAVQISKQAKEEESSTAPVKNPSLIIKMPRRAPPRNGLVKSYLCLCRFNL
jgi:hypothetical protein